MKHWIFLFLTLTLAACSSGAASTTSSSHTLDGGEAGHKTVDARAEDSGKPKDAEVRRDVASISAPPVPDGGGKDAAPLPPPLDAATGTWTWVDVPGSVCLNGSATGFAISPAPTPSGDLLIFMEGGGACWDGQSCWGPVSTSFYVQTGYGQVEFDTDPQVAAIYLLDRSASNNPFAGMNIVYVPYCSGDVFAGDKVTNLSYLGISHETHFKGYENVSLFLEYIRSTFPGLSHVWLAGDSAGGFGAAINFEHVQTALSSAHVDVLDDSGQPIEPASGLWTTWNDAWNIQFPSGCTSCVTSPGAFATYYESKYPGHRFGLISYEYDTVISTFMQLSLSQFKTELYALASQMDSDWPDGHYFILSGGSHVGLLAPTPALKTWVQELVDGSPHWASVKP